MCSVKVTAWSVGTHLDLTMMVLFTFINYSENYERFNNNEMPFRLLFAQFLSTFQTDKT